MQRRHAETRKTHMNIIAHLSHGRIAYSSNPKHVREFLKNMLAQGPRIKENPWGFSLFLQEEEVHVDFSPEELATPFFDSLRDHLRLLTELTETEMRRNTTTHLHTRAA